jgi:hypothetical protein
LPARRLASNHDVRYHSSCCTRVEMCQAAWRLRLS